MGGRSQVRRSMSPSVITIGEVAIMLLPTLHRSVSLFEYNLEYNLERSSPQVTSANQYKLLKHSTFAIRARIFKFSSYNCSSRTEKIGREVSSPLIDPS